MADRGPGLPERLLIYTVTLVVISVLLQEVARVVRAYAVEILIILTLVVVISIFIRAFFTRRW